MPQNIGSVLILKEVCVNGPLYASYLSGKIVAYRSRDL